MWEYIEPIARGDRYEDPLEAFLERNDLGELDGGGTQIGDVPKIEFVDVTFWIRDSDEAISAAVQEFERLGAPVGSQLQFQRGQTWIASFSRIAISSWQLAKTGWWPT